MLQVASDGSEGNVTFTFTPTSAESELIALLEANPNHFRVYVANEKIPLYICSVSSGDSAITLKTCSLKGVTTGNDKTIYITPNVDRIGIEVARAVVVNSANTAITYRGEFEISSFANNDIYIEVHKLLADITTGVEFNIKYYYVSNGVRSDEVSNRDSSIHSSLYSGTSEIAQENKYNTLLNSDSGVTGGEVTIVTGENNTEVGTDTYKYVLLNKLFERGITTDLTLSAMTDDAAGKISFGVTGGTNAEISLSFMIHTDDARIKTLQLMGQKEEGDATVLASILLTDINT